MDKKFKLLAATSLVVVLASGCTPYNARTGTYDNTQYGGSSQNLPIDNNNATCSSCQSNTTYSSTGEHSQQWYIDRWNREQNKGKYIPPKQTTYVGEGGRSQQWYIDRWNRQQQGQRNKPVYTPPPKKTYTGYGGAKPYVAPNIAPKNPGGNANYYDYSKQGGGYSASNKQLYTGSNAASNKQLYTGSSNATSKKDLYTGGNYNSKSYQPYAPKTYTSGANSNAYSDSSGDIYAASSSNDTYTSPSGNNSYTGGGGAEVASGSYNKGDRTYVVNKGDTVFSVMRLTGIYWKEIIKKNNLIAPYTISTGQTLRLK
jgi:hypothetical protein